MTVNIDYETEKELGIDYAALANQVADKVLAMEQCPYDAQINLVLTDNEEIKRVNTEFRNIQAPTDVLSFPMIPFETPGDYDIVEEDESYFDLDTDELLLGDIMISVDKVFAQAEEYGIFFPGCPQYASPSGVRSHDAGRGFRDGDKTGKSIGGIRYYKITI